jgi:hypothetical protein
VSGFDPRPRCREKQGGASLFAETTGVSALGVRTGASSTVLIEVRAEQILEVLVRFEVLTAVKISILVFWVVTSCGLVGRYRHFGGTYCLDLQISIRNYHTVRRYITCVVEKASLRNMKIINRDSEERNKEHRLLSNYRWKLYETL